MATYQIMKENQKFEMVDGSLKLVSKPTKVKTIKAKDDAAAIAAFYKYAVKNEAFGLCLFSVENNDFVKTSNL